jgi:hypothetical protein
MKAVFIIHEHTMETTLPKSIYDKLLIWDLEVEMEYQARSKREEENIKKFGPEGAIHQEVFGPPLNFKFSDEFYEAEEKIQNYITEAVEEQLGLDLDSLFNVPSPIVEGDVHDNFWYYVELMFENESVDGVNLVVNLSLLNKDIDRTVSDNTKVTDTLTLKEFRKLGYRDKYKKSEPYKWTTTDKS